PLRVDGTLKPVTIGALEVTQGMLIDLQHPSKSCSRKSRCNPFTNASKIFPSKVLRIMLTI
ncbi:MAG: hypothetical protein R3261_02895, partial [Alphaproteobacteria bacterium]|nr:hypothetical protein [Alphaproteobacteria bacterium]